MDDILTIRDVAIRLKMAERTVYAMAAGHELPAFKLRGQWRVRRADFEQWLAKMAASGIAAAEAASPERVGTPDVDAADPDRQEYEDAALEPARVATPSEPGVPQLSDRLSQADLHKHFVRLLGRHVIRHSDLDVKPLEVELAPPLPGRVRVYMYNATRPPGGRPLGEHKVQLIVPGQRRGERGSFDHGDGRIVLLIGYAAEEDVFVLWDAGLYPDFAWSRNVQVKAETIIEASAGKLATQHRQLRPATGRAVLETVLAAHPIRLAEALERRVQLTRERLLSE